MGWRRAFESLLHRAPARPAPRPAAEPEAKSAAPARPAVEPPDRAPGDPPARGEPDAAELAAALARLADSVENLEQALAGGRPKTGAAAAARPGGPRSQSAAKPVAAAKEVPEPRRDLIEDALTKRRHLSRQLEKLDPQARARLRILAETMMLGKPPPGR